MSYLLQNSFDALRALYQNYQNVILIERKKKGIKSYDILSSKFQYFEDMNILLVINICLHTFHLLCKWMLRISQPYLWPLFYLQHFLHFDNQHPDRSLWLAMQPRAIYICHVIFK